MEYDVITKRIAGYFNVNEDGSATSSEPTTEGEATKSYTPPASNYEILNQRHGRLLIDEGAGYLDLVVDQSMFLKMVDFRKVMGDKASIPINDLEAHATQVEDGVDPFDTAGNLSTYKEIGYDLTLETVKLCHRVKEEQIRAMMRVAGWTQTLSTQIAKASANEMLKIALCSTPSSGDNDLKAGYNYNFVTSAYKASPYIGMKGWLFWLKHGYTYDKDGSSVPVSPAHVVDTYVDGAFLSIIEILDALLLDFPTEYLVAEELRYFMSYQDKIKYRQERRKLYEFGQTNTETGDAEHHMGIKIETISFLKSYNSKVTISAVDYYPGMIWLGYIKDLKIRANMEMVEERFRYDTMKCVLDTMYITQFNFGTIPQRTAVAYKDAQ